MKARASAEDFAEAATRHLDDVHAFLVYLTGDRAVAEDLTAETFARALERWHRFDPRRGGPRTWLCQLARSTALDHFRSEERRAGARGATRRRGAREHGAGVRRRAVAGAGACSGAASAAEREVIALRVVLELDGEATARVLGISVSACSTRLSRALQKLEKEVSSGVAA